MAVPLIYFIVQKNELVGKALGFGSASVLIYVIFNMVTKLKKEENFRLALAMLLTLGSVVFFTLFEQAGSSLSLFAVSYTHLDVYKRQILYIATAYITMFQVYLSVILWRAN